MSPAGWILTLDERLYSEMLAQLFPGDGDEHGGVLAAGLSITSRGTRLLGRQYIPAIEGVEFVPGRRGYRMLTATFVRETLVYCRDEGLIYLAVHNHRGCDQVAFSDVDMASHERGYPALLDISGRPVGALVLAENALAGDIWTPDRVRRPIGETVVVGPNLKRLYPKPPPRPLEADPTFDRQARWFGDRGQERLGRCKVAVVGAGGVGLPLITMLARIGVGTIAVIDPERVEPVNHPRMPEATRVDTMMPLRRIPGLGGLADRLSTRKVSLARRAIRRANRRTRVLLHPTQITEHEAAQELVDADFIFLAADSHLARRLVNAVAHQYLVPTIQIGIRIDVDPKTGVVGDIRSNVRLILPTQGCLRCNELISASRLQEEAMGEQERERNRYVDEVPAPSVITFNTLSAAQAASDFMLMMGELIEPTASVGFVRTRPRQRRSEPVIPSAGRPGCPDCGTVSESRRARGDGDELPLPELAK